MKSHTGLHFSSFILESKGQRTSTFRPSLKVKVKSLSRVRLCDPMDCNISGSTVHGIFQERVLEWIAISFSRRKDPSSHPLLNSD